MVGRRHVIDVRVPVEFDRMVQNSAVFRELRDEREKILSSFPFLLQDIFYALFQEMPALLPIPEVSPGARLNRLILDQLMKNREFKRARVFTRRDPVGSAMVSMYFAELVFHVLNHEIIDVANEISSLEDELRDALLQVKVAQKITGIAAAEAREDAARLYRESADQWNLVAEQKNKNLRALAARLNMLWNTSGQKNLASSGDGKKGEKEGRFESGAEGLGDNKGTWTRGDLSSHLKLVENYLNSPKLKRLAQRVGRLREVREQKSGSAFIEDTTEIRGIDYGDDLSMVVPEEWVDYFDPLKRPGFQKRYAEEALCLYDMKGKRRKGRGSLVICIDNSGSMQGPKEETAKAIAIALMEIAAGQKRDFVVIMFGGPEDELKVFEVPRGRCTFGQLVEIGEHFLCSAGTDFEKPLQEAVRCLEKDKYRGGDIVFITDGVSRVSPEFLDTYQQQKRAKSFRTITVMVNYGDISTAPVEVFSDEILLSKDLKGIDIAGDLFGRMRRR